ncbi:Sec-independent protein translocase protein TatB [Nitrosomonas sp. ANs5]|uniref:Sec-independent protein translocase protein TatB n=1 Tax=Nitrosomonas sp. ANs5 TaxID=3423941 RepID=UPI003D35214E
MFDISFAELMIISIVALIVIGPERLPMVARTLGHLLGRARRYIENIKHDLREEMELDQLRKFKDSVQDTVNTFESSVHKEMRQIRQATDLQSPAADQDSPASADGKDAPPQAPDRAHSAQPEPRQSQTAPAHNNHPDKN